MLSWPPNKNLPLGGNKWDKAGTKLGVRLKPSQCQSPCAGFVIKANGARAQRWGHNTAEEATFRDRSSDSRKKSKKGLF